MKLPFFGGATKFLSSLNDTCSEGVLMVSYRAAVVSFDGLFLSESGQLS